MGDAGGGGGVGNEGIAVGLMCRFRKRLPPRVRVTDGLDIHQAAFNEFRMPQFRLCVLRLYLRRLAGYAHLLTDKQLLSPTRLGLAERTVTDRKRMTR